MRYYVQSSQVRGEPRFYWVVDSKAENQNLPDWTTDKRKAERQCAKFNKDEEFQKK